MKVENMLKLKEEFDYKSLARRLDIQLDKLFMEHERKQKAFEDEIERITTAAQNQISEAERNYADAMEVRFFTSIVVNGNADFFFLFFAFVGVRMHACMCVKCVCGREKEVHFSSKFSFSLYIF